MLNAQDAVSVLEQEQDDHRRYNTGGEGADAGAQGAHAEAENQDGIDGNIDDVDDQGVEHGHLGVAHGAEQGGPRVVERHKGVGQGSGDKVDHGGFHDVFVDAAEDQEEQVLPEDETQNHDDRGEHRHHVEQLLGSGLGVVGLLAAQVLGHHHRAAGTEGGENLEHQGIDVIHQRDAGHRRLTGCGDHHRIRHTHGHQKKLLNYQRDDQPHQHLTAEQRLILGGLFPLGTLDLGLLLHLHALLLSYTQNSL